MSNKEFWPDDTSVAASAVHRTNMNGFGASRYPNGNVPWTAAKAPDLTCGHNLYTTGRLRSCGYCGSMHPTDLVAALKAGARVSWADFKYGWPHKLYVDGVPNPFAGMANSTTSTGHGSKLGECNERDREYIASNGGLDQWVQLRSSFDFEKKDEFASHPWHRKDVERSTTHGKFYTEHLQDATLEEREVIERAMDLCFTFEPSGMVRWKKYGT